jgi:gamma-glutamyltranspeptidase/glutathione hydrolase
VGDETVVERGLPATTVQALEARGHHLVVAPSPWGGAQAILIDHARGVLIAGSDPRKDGCALGY